MDCQESISSPSDFGFIRQTQGHKVLHQVGHSMGQYFTLPLNSSWTPVDSVCSGGVHWSPLEFSTTESNLCFYVNIYDTSKLDSDWTPLDSTKVKKKFSGIW